MNYELDERPDCFKALSYKRAIALEARGLLSILFCTNL